MPELFEPAAIDLPEPMAKLFEIRLGNMPVSRHAIVYPNSTLAIVHMIALSAGFMETIPPVGNLLRENVYYNEVAGGGGIVFFNQGDQGVLPAIITRANEILSSRNIILVPDLPIARC